MGNKLMAQKLKDKSLARELGVIIVVFWAYVVMNLSSDTIAAITPWVFTYLIAAFGLDKYKKMSKQDANSDTD